MDRKDSGVSQLGSKSISAAIHPFFLTFLDAEQEARYSHFSYVTSGFYGGKLWHFLAFAINIAFYLYYHGVVQGFNEQMFIGNFWVGLLINSIVTILMFVCLFIEQLYEYREIFYLITLFTHWPAYTITAFFGMGERWPYRYMFVIGCLFFCTFVVQARFSRSIWFLTLSPIITLVISTSTMTEYWDGISAMEIGFWIMLFVPPTTLRMFERTSRRAFVKMEKCEERIDAVNRQIERTEDLIVSFFAKTPTRDFLADGKRAVRSRRYPDTTMIVTDMAGFTAWTSRTAPNRVIMGISNMFAAMDAISMDYDVEKVSTVGDCFMGAVFPSETEKHERASNAVEFSTRILNSGGECQLRIGVHIGFVTAAFVGNKPPKFDLFGEAFEQAKVMESAGVPGKVHVSATVMDAIGAFATPTDDVQQTPLGVVFSEWERAVPKEEAVNDIEFFTSQEVFNVCQALIKMSQVSPVKKEEATNEFEGMGVQVTASIMIDDSADRQNSGQLTSQNSLTTQVLSGDMERQQSSDYLTATTLNAQIPSLGNSAQYSGSSFSSEGGTSNGGLGKKKSSNFSARQNLPKSSSKYFTKPAAVDSGIPSMENSGVEMGEQRQLSHAPSSASNFSLASVNLDDDVEMNPMLLQFVDQENEKLFKMYLKDTGLVFKCSVVGCVLEGLTVLCHLLMGCFDTNQNRILVGMILLVFLFFLAILITRYPVPYWNIFVLAVFESIAIMATFITVGCTEESTFYTGAIIEMYYINGVIVSQFMLEYRLTVRLALCVTTCGAGMMSIIVRNLVFDDGVLPYGPVWAVGVLGLGFCSYFADYTLRAAFAAERLLNLALRKMRGKHHETAKGAMDVMLPQFVSEKILGTSMAAANLDDENDATQDDHFSKASEQLWDFDAVCVMFVNFTPEADDLEQQLEIINATLDKVEGILSAGNIHKIKTIGSTLMCVSGIDGSRDCSSMMAHAALEIVAKVFVTKPSWKYSIGIHYGSCFGAVLGTKSMIFDIFGDTVNMASRMGSTAKPRSIQVTTEVAEKCEKDKRLLFERNPPVFVKGKGNIETMTLRLLGGAIL